MNVRKGITARGHFPKELPPGFTTIPFADFICIRNHPLAKVKTPACSEPVVHRLQRPSAHPRLLSIPNPFHHYELVSICTTHFSQLLALAASSPFSSSRPVFEPHFGRAIQPNRLHVNLGIKKQNSRSARRLLLTTDVKSYYPSIYSHAVAWAISPTSRTSRKEILLGNRIDKHIRKMQGRRSIGLPVGPDISLLLAECLLARVDKGMKSDKLHSFRWYDDYEFATTSSDEADRLEAELQRQLNSFHLTLSNEKTCLEQLPKAIDPLWKIELRRHDTKGTSSSVSELFDLAFHFRERYPNDQIINYALSKLFDAKLFGSQTELISDLICQSVIAEPSCLPKASSLLIHYHLNGKPVRLEKIREVIVLLVELSSNRDIGSDIAWCLYLAKSLGIVLPVSTGKKLSKLDDNIVAILSMDLASTGNLDGWSNSYWEKRVTKDAVWGPHWLAVYEGVLKGWLADPKGYVSGDPHFGELYRSSVHFYDPLEPAWAAVVHPSGAPWWLTKSILDSVGKFDSVAAAQNDESTLPVVSDNQDDEMAEIDQMNAYLSTLKRSAFWKRILAKSSRRTIQIDLNSLHDDLIELDEY